MKEILVYLEDEKQATCICPKCGYKTESGNPCPEEEKCPECKTTLVAEEEDKMQATEQMENETTGEKAGRRVRGDRVSLVKKIADELDDVKAALLDFLGWADYEDEPVGKEEKRDLGPFSWIESGDAIKAIESAGERGSSFVAFKAADGSDWFLTFSTNAFEDREGEIFATKAIEDYVARHEDEDVKGVYQFWHLPGSKFGDIKWQSTVGRFLVEAGPFDNTPMGRAFKEFFSVNPAGHPVVAPDGWGCSHKYEYKSADRTDGVYDWFEKSETTVLPLDAAANIYTAPLFLGKEQTMNERQKEALELIGGNDLVRMVETAGRKATESLEGSVNYKAGNYATMVRKIAEAAEDEAVKKQLMNIASELDDTYPKPKKQVEEEKYPKPEKKPEDEKAMTPAKIAQRLRMLAGRLEGKPASDLRKIAESLAGAKAGAMMEEEEEEKPAEKKQVGDEFVQAVGDSFAAIVEGYKSNDAEIVGAITELTNAVKSLQDEVQRLARDDEDKIAEKAADTPAASLREMVGRAIGDPSTRVDGRKKYGKDRPKETQPIVEGQTGISLIDTFVSGADQRQLTQ